VRAAPGGSQFERLSVTFITSAIIGFFFGFGLGAGCSLAVMYSIYSGGYRRALEDSLRDEKPERYRRLYAKAVLRAQGGRT
jgi:hypothetical protein